MFLRSSDEEKTFIKNLKNLKLTINEISSNQYSELYFEIQNKVILQVQILWMLKNSNIYNLHVQINNFIENISTEKSENLFFSLLNLINTKPNGKHFTFDFNKEMKFDYKNYFELGFQFIKTCEKEEITFDGYLIGLTYEYLLFNQQRSKTGSFYTPRSLAKIICKKTIDLFIVRSMKKKFTLLCNENLETVEKLRDLINQEQKEYLKILLTSMKIFDPSLGTGNFLIESFNYLLFLYRFFDLKFNDCLVLLANSVFGIDINPISTKIAKLRILLILIEQSSSTNINMIGEEFVNILTANSITNLPPIKSTLPFKNQKQTENFHIIVSNPPHGAKLDPNLKKLAKKHFKTVSGFKRNEKDLNHKKLTKGNPNSAVLFTEICGELLLENGFCAIILPKSLLYIEAWESTRVYLTSEHINLVSIIDLQKGFDNVLLEQVVCIFTKKKVGLINMNNGTNELLESYPETSIEEFDNSNELRLVRTTTLNSDKFIITNNENYIPIYSHINKTKQIFPLLSHRGLVISKYLENKKTNTNLQVIRGKDIQPLFIRSLSYCPSEKIQYYNYFDYGTLMIQRIVAHVINPSPHIILTVALNPGIPTVDTIVNIYRKELNPNFSKMLGVYIHSELINWYTYHFIYCEAIRSMDMFGYYLNQIPIKNFELHGQIIQIFELLTLLKTIHNMETSLIKNIESKINFLDRIANAFIYYIYFKDIQLQDLEFSKKIDFNGSFRDHLILKTLQKFDFDQWYKLEQFSDIENWNVDYLGIDNELISLMTNNMLLLTLKTIESHPWVKIIKKEFVEDF